MPDPFDLERLRKNWGRDEEPVVVPEPVRSAGTERAAKAPRPRTDPYVEARALLARIRALSLATRATHDDAEREAVAPFLHRAEGLVEEMALNVGGAGGERDQTPRREELLEVLVNLEDLFDVFAMTPRRAP